MRVLRVSQGPRPSPSCTGPSSCSGPLVQAPQGGRTQFPGPGTPAARSLLLSPDSSAAWGHPHPVLGARRRGGPAAHSPPGAVRGAGGGSRGAGAGAGAARGRGGKWRREKRQRLLETARQGQMHPCGSLSSEALPTAGAALGEAKPGSSAAPTPRPGPAPASSGAYLETHGEGESERPPRGRARVELAGGARASPCHPHWWGCCQEL